MAILFVKRERSERVPLGTQLRTDGHWSTQGLALVHTCSDLTEQSRPHGERFAPTSAPTLRNDGILFDANAEYVSAGLKHSPISTSKPITVLAIGTCNVSNTTRKRMFRLSEPTYGTVVTIDFADGTTNRVLFAVRIGTSTFITAGAAGSLAPAANKRYALVGRHIPGGVAQLFIDGVYADQSASSGTMHLAPDTCTIGGNTGTLTFNGVASLVLVWNRYLSEAEIRAITANPYQIFQPLLVPVFAGAGGTTSSADSGSFTISGSDSTSARQLLGAADSGTLAITGSDAVSVRGLLSSADIGTINIAGVNAVSIRQLFISAESGNYALTGVDASSFVTAPVDTQSVADAGSHTLTGYNATSVRSLLSSATPGAHALAGFDAVTQTSLTSAADTGAYALTGYNATSAKTSNQDTLSVAYPGAYYLTGFATTTNPASSAQYKQEYAPLYMVTEHAPERIYNEHAPLRTYNEYAPLR